MDIFWFFYCIGSIFVSSSVAIYAITSKKLHNIDIKYNRNFNALKKYLSSFKEDKLCDKIIFSEDRTRFKIVQEDKEYAIFLVENLINYPKNYLPERKKLFKNARKYLQEKYKFDRLPPDNKLLDKNYMTERSIAWTLNQILKKYICFVWLRRIEMASIVSLVVGITIQIICICILGKQILNLP